MPLLLGGCGEKEMTQRELEVRDGLMYIKDSETPYTGEQFLFYENGKKEQKVNYKDGKFNGFAISWHENGKKKMEGSWKNGKEDGLHTQWHESGKKSMESQYKDGKMDGLALQWHENGQKQTEANTKNDKLISVKHWNSKGDPVDSRVKTLKPNNP